MLIVAGTLQVDPAGRDDYLESCISVVEGARKAPGCLDFAITADPIDPGRLNVFERWESDEALDEFRGGGPSDDQQGQILEASVEKYRISGVEPP